MPLSLSDLRPAQNSRRPRKRLGRGESSGHGKTSGRGNKGQSARAGNDKKNINFEGGQMPLHRRTPKYGFNNRAFQQRPVPVNLDQIAKKFHSGETVDCATLKAKRILNQAPHGVKILARGELAIALTFKVHGISEAARKKIEAAKGTVEIVA